MSFAANSVSYRLKDTVIPNMIAYTTLLMRAVINE